MKRLASILVLTFALALTAQAQIFLEEGETNDNRAPAEDWGVVPYHGVTHDQADYVPAGSGIMMLAVLGGAYLLGKKKGEKVKEY